MAWRLGDTRRFRGKFRSGRFWRKFRAGLQVARFWGSVPRQGQVPGKVPRRFRVGSRRGVLDAMVPEHIENDLVADGGVPGRFPW